MRLSGWTKLKEESFSVAEFAGKNALSFTTCGVSTARGKHKNYLTLVEYDKRGKRGKQGSFRERGADRKKNRKANDSGIPSHRHFHIPQKRQ